MFDRKSSVEIILVKYNVPRFERNTIKSIINNTDEPYHLTVWQNRSKDENLSVIWNKLIKRSTADYICLLNTDVALTPNWLDDLLEVFDKEENVGIVSCITNICGVRKQMQPLSYRYRVEEVGMLSGFCMVFPKSVWNKVKFDEDYKLYGEDSQFCLDVKKIGYNLLIRKDVFITHYKGKSAARARHYDNKDTFKIAAESARLLREKSKFVPEYLKNEIRNRRRKI